jgi:hypothetical protein
MPSLGEVEERHNRPSATMPSLGEVEERHH